MRHLPGVKRRAGALSINLFSYSNQIFCPMDHLFLLQFACFLFMLFNAFTLAVTRLQTRWLNPRYERARWLIFVGIMGLAAHYLMQMRYGFRAVDDAVGATVNALVYAPCFSLISMGIFHIEATHVRRRRVYAVCTTINLAIFACFFIGFLHYGSMRIGAWLYAMQALFAANVVYCIVVIVREIIKRRRLLETMAGGDIMPYVRYSRASLLILFFPALVSPFAIISTKLLYFFAPLGLMAFLFFVLSFVALGYSYQPKESLLDEEAEEKVSPVVVVAQQEKTVAQQAVAAHGVASADVASPSVVSPGEAAPCDGAHAGTTPDNATSDSASHADAAHAADQAEETQTATLMPEDRKKQIQQRLDEWCAAMGYKDGGGEPPLPLPCDPCLERRTHDILRPVSEDYVPDMAERHPLRCGQENDDCQPRLQQRHHLLRMWFYFPHPPLPHLQGA